MRVFLRSSALVSLAVIAPVAMAIGPKDVLFMGVYNSFQGPHNGLYRIQGDDTLTISNTRNGTDGAFAVSGDVRTLGSTRGEYGSTFGLGGNLLVQNSTYNTSPGYYFDGTSDGVYNYSVDMNSNNVMRFGRDWSSPVALFHIAEAGNHYGITFDSGSKSFWISNTPGFLTRYSMSGTELAVVDVGVSQLKSLAYDPGDQTIWATSGDQVDDLYQFTRSGTLLQDYRPTGVPVVREGLEFDIEPTPEPGTLLVLAAGGVQLLRRRNRVRQARLE